MQTVEIRVEGNTAHCDELGMFVSGDSPEDSIRRLTEMIRGMWGCGVYAFKLPYMGQDFAVRWEDIKFKKPPPEDEFEQAQKAYEFPKEKEIL